MAANRVPSLSRTSRESGLIVIQLHGDLDTFGAREIGQAFSAAFADRTQHSVIDVCDVGFMGSAGLAMLAMAAQVARRGGGSVALAGAEGLIADVIQMSGFGDLLPSYATLDLAIAEVESRLAPP